MVSNKDINWIHAHIQSRHRQAIGVEKSILGEVLGLFEAAPEFAAVLTVREDIPDEQLMQMLKEASRNAVIIPGGCEPSIELVEPVKWIPVTERLPKDRSERVLVKIKYADSITGSPAMDTDRYVIDEWMRYGDFVTHWMPLPEPPKEDA